MDSLHQFILLLLLLGSVSEVTSMDISWSEWTCFNHIRVNNTKYREGFIIAGNGLSTDELWDTQYKFDESCSLTRLNHSLVPGNTNIALEKHSWQVSPSTVNPPIHAVDGRLCTSLASTDFWWFVELGAALDIAEIDLYLRGNGVSMNILVSPTNTSVVPQLPSPDWRTFGANITRSATIVVATARSVSQAQKVAVISTLSILLQEIEIYRKKLKQREVGTISGGPSSGCTIMSGCGPEKATDRDINTYFSISSGSRNLYINFNQTMVSSYIVVKYLAAGVTIIRVKVISGASVKNCATLNLPTSAISTALRCMSEDRIIGRVEVLITATAVFHLNEIEFYGSELPHMHYAPNMRLEYSNYTALTTSFKRHSLPVNEDVKPTSYIVVINSTLGTDKKSYNHDNCMGGTERIVSDWHGLVPDHTYNFTVSCNITNIPCIKEPIHFSARTPSAYHLPPRNVLLTEGVDYCVILSWEPPLYSDYWRFKYQYACNGGEWITVNQNIIRITDCSFRHDFIINCSVKANSTHGPSEIASITLQRYNTANDLPPQNISVMPGTDFCFVLSWERPLYSDSRDISFQYKCMTQEWFESEEDTRNITICDYKHEYSIECSVKAVTIVGNSEIGDAMLYRNRTADDLPPTKVSITEDADYCFILSWESPLYSENRALNYQYRCLSQEWTDSEQGYTNASVCLFRHDTRLNCSVRVNTSVRFSEVSNFILLRNATAYELPPTNVSVVLGDSYCFTLIWDPPLYSENRPISYLYRCLTQDWLDPITNYNNASICEFKHDTFINCSVRAITPNGESKHGNFELFRNDTAKTLPPTELSLMEDTDYCFVLSWAPPLYSENRTLSYLYNCGSDIWKRVKGRHLNVTICSYLHEFSITCFIKATAVYGESQVATVSLNRTYQVIEFGNTRYILTKSLQNVVEEIEETQSNGIIDKTELHFLLQQVASLTRDELLWVKINATIYKRGFVNGRHVWTEAPPTAANQSYTYVYKSDLYISELVPLTIEDSDSTKCDGYNRHSNIRTSCSQSYGEKYDCYQSSEYFDEAACCIKREILDEVLIPDNAVYNKNSSTEMSCRYDTETPTILTCDLTGSWLFNRTSCEDTMVCQVEEVSGTKILATPTLPQGQTEIKIGETVYFECLDGYERVGKPRVAKLVCNENLVLEPELGVSPECTPYPLGKFNWHHEPGSSQGICLGTNIVPYDFMTANGNCLNQNGTLLDVDLNDAELVEYLLRIVEDKSLPLTMWVNYGLSASSTCHSVTFSESRNVTVQEETCEISLQSLCRSDVKLINGGWSNWEEWTACDVANNKRERNRFCNQPIPACGGFDCEGNGTVVEYCCSDPGHITGSRREDTGRRPGDTVKYTCLDGFKTSASTINTELVCQNNGTWNTRAPNCERVPCRINNGENYQVKLPSWLSPPLLYEDEFSAICDEGFVVTGTHNITTQLSTCSANRRADPPIKNCVEKECSTLTNSSSQRVTIVTRNNTRAISIDKNIYGDVVWMECRIGYKFKDLPVETKSLYLECAKHGVWDPTVPQCLEVNCPLSNLIQRGNFESSMENVTVRGGETISLRCAIGYERNSGLLEETLTCVDGELWSPEFPEKCLIVNCGRPGEGSNVERVEGRDYSYGSEVIFLCPENHIDNNTRLQSVTLRCEADKFWSLPPPNCIPIQCEKPRLGDGLQMIPLNASYIYNTKLTVNCLPTYNIDGFKDLTNWTWTCGVTGEWDSTPEQRCVKELPYSDLTVVTTESLGVVQVTFIQSRAYSDVLINYNLTFTGSHVFSNSSPSYYFVWSVNTSGLHTRDFTLKPGYTYELRIRSAEVERDIYLENNLKEIVLVFLPSGIPALLEGYNDSSIQPHFYPSSQNQTFDIQISESFIEVAVRQGFSNENGEITGFTLLVCERNPLYDKSFYNGQFPPELPTYDQINVVEWKGIWLPYQAFPRSDFFTNEDSLLPVNNSLRKKRSANSSGDNNSPTQSVPKVKPKPLYDRLAGGNIESEVIIKIGEGSCFKVKNRSYCNGQLRSHKAYCFKLRAFTSDGHLDSKCSNYVWTSGFGELSYSLVLPLVLSTLPILCLVSLAVYCALRPDSEFNMAFIQKPSKIVGKARILGATGGHGFSLNDLEDFLVDKPQSELATVAESFALSAILGHEIFYNRLKNARLSQTTISLSSSMKSENNKLHNSPKKIKNKKNSSAEKFSKTVYDIKDSRERESKHHRSLKQSTTSANDFDKKIKQIERKHVSSTLHVDRSKKAKTSSSRNIEKRNTELSWSTSSLNRSYVQPGKYQSKTSSKKSLNKLQRPCSKWLGIAKEKIKTERYPGWKMTDISEDLQEMSKKKNIQDDQDRNLRLSGPTLSSTSLALLQEPELSPFQYAKKGYLYLDINQNIEEEKTISDSLILNGLSESQTEEKNIGGDLALDQQFTIFKISKRGNSSTHKMCSVEPKANRTLNKQTSLKAKRPHHSSRQNKKIKSGTVAKRNK